MRCLDPDASQAMVERIDQAHKDGDTLGGVVEVVVHGLPPGPRLARALGPPPRRPARRRADGHPGDQGRRGRRRLRARRHPRLPGPRRDRRRPTAGMRRTSGRSGGTEGGMTTGELLRVRAAMKPIATVPAGAAHRRRRHRRGGRRPPPALGRLRRARCRHRRRGDGRAGARRRRAREVRRRLGAARPGATSRPTSTR